MSRRSNTFFSLSFTFFCIFSLFIDAVVAQRWVLLDDTNSTLSYTGVWQQGPCGPSCLYPDLSNIYNETWHVAQPSRSSGDTSVSLQFTGYGVFVSMITDDLDSQHMSVQVTLDGVSQAYYHNSVMDGTIKTGAILVNRDDLAGGPHTLTIDVYAESIFMLDFIGYMESRTNDPEVVTTPIPSSSPPSDTSSSSQRGSATASTTVPLASSGPSGSATSAGALPTTTGGSSGIDTLGHYTAAFNPATFSNAQMVTVSMSTTVDAAGSTRVIPVYTITAPGNDSDPTSTVNHYNPGNSSVAFSPALAGAIGAAVAAVAAALIVVFLVCMRRRKRVRPRPGSAEPYMLANSTPSSQGSHLTPRLSPDPYAPESVLGLYTMPYGPDFRTQPDLLLSSPPPNHTLMSPISPNRPYYPSQNLTVTTPSSDQYLNPYTNNSLTPISPSHPQPYYSPYYPYPVEKLNRHSSNNRLHPNMAEPPVTPLVPRPSDWIIESHSETGAPTAPPPAPRSPAMLLPSPAILTPSPRSPRRRSGRQKEMVDEQFVPPIPHMSGNQVSAVPILGNPSVLRRGRRRTDGAEMRPRMGEGRNPASDEESLPPVVRRQSLSHPAPPAYSPPRLVRNTDLREVLLD